MTHAADRGLVGRLVGRFGARTSVLSWRGLKEAAVSADGLVGGVASQLREGLSDVEDWRVGLQEVAEDEGNGAVHSTQGDLGVGTGCESVLGGQGQSQADDRQGHDVGCLVIGGGGLED